MANSTHLADIKCPWCAEGRIVIHDPQEEWWVTTEGDAASESYSGKFPAGIRRKRFKTPPVAWFSCTNCAMTGTVGYLEMILHQAKRGRHPPLSSGSGQAVKRGTLTGVVS